MDEASPPVFPRPRAMKAVLYARGDREQKMRFCDALCPSMMRPKLPTDLNKLIFCKGAQMNTPRWQFLGWVDSRSQSLELTRQSMNSS